MMHCTTNRRNSVNGCTVFLDSAEQQLTGGLPLHIPGRLRLGCLAGAIWNQVAIC